MRQLLVKALLLALLLFPALVRADDGIFPPTAQAKQFIDFDGKGFLVNGKRTFLASGSLHYSRLPRAMWRDVLLRMKRLGFNTVQTYAFWNFHEPQEGKWDFSGDKDLDAFLKTAKQVGLYAVVRVGPYVCAEWDSGGYPVWLRGKANLRVRVENPVFEGAVDKWMEHVMPIVAQNQINRGGNVIMVQLENEHPAGWGREMPNNYFKHLRDKAIALGLEVPHFFSGLHHGSDPAGNKSWDSKGRENPWYTTEFWPGWYDLYGPLAPERLRFFTRGQEKIVAYGGNGYNFYMLYGGTNFETWNNNEDASCYDYAGAIGQAGDLRPIAYNFKRVNWFAQSFADILENSENADADYQNEFAGKNLRVTARKSPEGTLVFLDNNSKETIRKGDFWIAPGEIASIVQNYQLTPELTIDKANAHIVGITRQGDTTTIVVRGEAEMKGDAKTMEGGALEFSVAKGVKRILVRLQTDGEWKVAPADMKYFQFPLGFPTDEKAIVSTFKLDKKTVRILAVNNEVADRTWFVEAGGKNLIVTGPDYVGDATANGKTLKLTTERAVGNHFATMVYDETDKPVKFAEALTASPVSIVPKLAAWQMRRADTEARPDFADTTWTASEQPQQMGADGDNSAYAWYRAKITVPKDGDYPLLFGKAGDWISVFLNGKPVFNADRKTNHLQKVALHSGENTLAVFTAHYGRDKLFNYLGALDVADPKGIFGPVTMPQHELGSANVTKWRWMPDTRNTHDTPDTIALTDNSWKETTIGRDVFNRRRGFAWYAATLENIPGPHRRITFADVDDNGTVYLNGKKLIHHEGWGQPFDVTLDSAWKEGGPNELLVLVENTDNTGGVNGAVTLQTTQDATDPQVTNWKMRGGWPYLPGESDAWTPYAEAPKVPAVYRTTFTADAPAANGPQPVLRVALKGMSKGFVWLNGHNLGRYPEKTPANGVWLPPCWLKAGENELVVFDEQGNAPDGATLLVEEAATRIAQVETK